MTKEELEKAYFWEIKLFYENEATYGDLSRLLEIVYRGGYNDGWAERGEVEHDI